MLDVGLLLLVLLLLHDLVVADSLLEGVVVAGVVGEPALREPDDVGAYAVEEVLRVAHEDEALLVLGQVPLEPHARLQIEVVGGLVQQQQSGLGKERLGKRDAHAPASGHVLGGPVDHDFGESEGMEELGGPDLEGVGIDLVESIVDGLQSLVLGSKVFHDVLLELLEADHLVLELIDDGLKRGSVRGLGLLAKVVEVDVIRDGHLALGEALEEVGLATAVLAEEAISATDGDLDVAILDELAAVHAHGEIVDLDVARGRAGCEVTGDGALKGALGEVAGSSDGGFLRGDGHALHRLLEGGDFILTLLLLA